MTIQVLDTIPGTFEGAPVSFYVIHDDEVPDRRAIVHLQSRTDRLVLARALDDMAYGFGRAWDHIAQLLSAQAYWPVWMRLAEDVRAEGERVRQGLPLLRHCEATLDPRRGIPFRDEWERFKLYESEATLDLAPADPEDGGRGALLESEELRLKPYFDIAKRVSPIALNTYFKETQRGYELIEVPNGGLPYSEQRQLEAAGLLVPASNAPLQVLMRRVIASELYAPIKERRLVNKQLKLPAYELPDYRAWYVENLPRDPELEPDLRGSAWLGTRAAFLPPPGVTWFQLQDFRFAYTQMLRDLALWLGGAPVGAVGTTHFAKLA